MYFLSGTGVCLDDGAEVPVGPACAITAPGVTATVSSTPAQSLW